MKYAQKGQTVMDLKESTNREELERRIAALLHEYDVLFQGMISNPDTYKKSALLYYWLRDYKNYLKNEAAFSPNFYPEFHRGNIVNVNLGFNLGAEMGGLHYAIVLGDSNRKNPNLVILPLTSVKPSKNLNALRPTELYIGEELYHKIQGKYTALRTSIPSEIKLFSQTTTKHDDLYQKRLQELKQKIVVLDKTMKKLQTLKHGSIVVLNQIRTISKMRVSDPTDSYDILYNLRLSEANLTAVGQGLQRLYFKST